MNRHAHSYRHVQELRQSRPTAPQLGGQDLAAVVLADDDFDDGIWQTSPRRAAERSTGGRKLGSILPIRDRKIHRECGSCRVGRASRCGRILRFPHVKRNDV